MRTAWVLIATALLPLTAYAATVNINTASAVQLDALPGIGPAKAAAIVDYRTKQGAFAKIEDIQNVSGIGPVTFNNMKDQITVGVPEAGTVLRAAPPQPSPLPTSYKKVQAVEPITSPRTNVQVHEKAVSAPTATVEPAAVGALLPQAEPVRTKNPRAAGLMHGPWTLGLLGVILVAGGAFIFI